MLLYHFYNLLSENRFFLSHFSKEYESKSIAEGTVNGASIAG